jgi:hypothetical protein
MQQHENANFIFFSGQISDLPAPLCTSISVVLRSCTQEADPIIHKLLRVFPRCTKIHQFDLSVRGKGRAEIIGIARTNLPCLGIPQKICPVRISLHNPEYKQLLQTKLDYSRGDLSSVLCQLIDNVKLIKVAKRTSSRSF